MEAADVDDTLRLEEESESLVELAAFVEGLDEHGGGDIVVRDSAGQGAMLAASAGRVVVRTEDAVQRHDAGECIEGGPLVGGTRW